MDEVPCYRLGRFGTGGLLSHAASCSVFFINHVFTHT